MAILYTSLSEIKSFYPCSSGWKDILKGQKKTESDNIPFPILEAVESNNISDVCWLLGKRKNEIQICVKFARMCANSVKHLNNDNATYAAAAYATYAANAANAANDAAAYAAYDAATAAYDAAYDAAYAAAYANAAAYDADAKQKQEELNKQFLIQCINEYQNGTL